MGSVTSYGNVGDPLPQQPGTGYTNVLALTDSMVSKRTQIYGPHKVNLEETIGTMELSNARINRFSDGFFPSTSRLWNSLPSSVFPASSNLPSFKRQVYHHLRDQMTSFLDIS